MQETVYVSQAESLDSAIASIAELFRAGRYDEIARVIGLYSILADAPRTRTDQARLYRSVLDLIKGKLRKDLGSGYAPWLEAFPKLLAGLVAGKQPVADAASIEVIASRQDGHGPFRSLDDFYFWALDDRRLSLGQIMKYVERTAKK